MPFSLQTSSIINCVTSTMVFRYIPQCNVRWACVSCVPHARSLAALRGTVDHLATKSYYNCTYFLPHQRDPPTTATTNMGEAQCNKRSAGNAP